MSKGSAELNEIARVVSKRLSNLFTIEVEDETYDSAQTNHSFQSIRFSFLVAIRDVFASASKVLSKESWHLLLESLSVEAVYSKLIIPVAKASQVNDK